MCWYSKNFPEDHLLELTKEYGPKKVYKILTDDLMSPFQEYHYTYDTPNDEINLHAGISIKDGMSSYCIREGYHSYDSKENTMHDYIALSSCFEYRYGESSVFIYECVIPEGSYYYRNSRGEVVSSNIIIKKQVI